MSCQFNLKSIDKIAHGKLAPERRIADLRQNIPSMAAQQIVLQHRQ
jgi:hypothetical protein